MSGSHPNTFPKLHNAMWPGLVGKGSPGAEPSHRPGHDARPDRRGRGRRHQVRRRRHLPLRPAHQHRHQRRRPQGGRRQDRGQGIRRRLGRRAGLVRRLGDGRRQAARELPGAIRKACRIARTLRELGVRPYGVVRIDSACSPADWAKDPEGNQKKIAETFKQAAAIARDHGERLAAEGEICWGGMHSWRRMVDLLERVGEPETVGFQADMAHTLLYTLGENAPEDRILPEGYDWNDRATLDEALKTLTAALRPWTIDFHVAQNDATVFGSGTHDHTGRHCLATDPNGKLDIPHHAGFWLRDEKGQLTKAIRHICWDGCMFPNAVHDEARDLERHPGRDDRGPRRTRLDRVRSGPRRADSPTPWTNTGSAMSAKKPLNIGIVGYGFMGRTHSNAYKRVNDFFDVEYRPVLKAVCGRTAEQAPSVRRPAGATSRSRPTGASWSSARISTRSTSARPTTRTPRSPSPRPRPAR